MTYTTNRTEETKRVAADLAATFQGGEIVALEGELGAGKTAFAQGVCGALGVEGAVTSPTFAIMNVYEVRRGAGSQVRRVVHLDLYRLKSAREIAALGLEEYLGAPDTIALIEWPGAVDGVEWKPTHTVRLAATSPIERTITIEYGNGGNVVFSGNPVDA